MNRVVLKGRGDFAAWRDAARKLLQTGTAPESIDWMEEDDEATDLFGGSASVSAPDMISLAGTGSTPVGTITVSRDFLMLAESVLCHSDPARFSLLYRLLFRLQRDRSLMAVLSDPDVARLHALEKSVRRDSHKMKAFVRFKEILPDAGTVLHDCGRRRFVAWFEPDHHIVARVAPFFQRRFTDMDWLIATPKGSAAWDGESLKVSSQPAVNPMMSDGTDALWRTYFVNIFNAARLKVKAMQAEMPKKYWKNLPEADLIPGLIAGAETAVRAMAQRAATQPPLFHERLQSAGPSRTVPAMLAAGSIEQLRDDARTCTRCALHCRATQTVFGEGPVDARIMFIGEQPGDQEDLAGRPFVGPAGKVFDAHAAEVGVDRSAAYVTNAVKHFKYEPRGKRRIHRKPTMDEVQHCRWWLKGELDLIKPVLVMAMGATALAAVTDGRQRLSDLRGRFIPLGPAQSLFVTVHPSYLFRIPDETKRREETGRFVQDLAAIAACQDSLLSGAVLTQRSDASADGS